MTTIVAERGVGIFGDRLGGGGNYCYRANKVYSVMTKSFGPVLYAGAGMPSLILNFKKYLETEEGEFPSLAGCRIILLTKEDRIFTFDVDSYSVNAGEEIDQPYFVEGSGAPAMLACLKAGCAKKDAFRITSEIDTGTGPDYDFIPVTALEDLARKHQSVTAKTKKRRWWQWAKS